MNLALCARNCQVISGAPCTRFLMCLCFHCDLSYRVVCGIFNLVAPDWSLPRLSFQSRALTGCLSIDGVHGASRGGTKGAVFLKEGGGGGRCEGRESVLLGRAVNSFLACCSLLQANRAASVTPLNDSRAVRPTGTFVDQVHLLFAGNRIR